MAEKGDFFRINLPAPGNSTGDGYDWVHVEDVRIWNDNERDMEYAGMIVRPSRNPASGDAHTAHFFEPTATSTFSVRRTGRTIYAEVHGRNEQPNTDTRSWLDKVRNAVVAIAAMLGLSKPQWKGLVTGLLADE